MFGTTDRSAAASSGLWALVKEGVDCRSGVPEDGVDVKLLAGAGVGDTAGDEADGDKSPKTEAMVFSKSVVAIPLLSMSLLLV